MTIKSEVSRARYVSNGVTNNFAISFPYLTNNDGTAQIAVYVGDSDTPLVEGEDYTVNGFGKYDDYSEQVDDGLITYETRYEGGEVLLKEVPADQVPVAIVRNIPQTQGVVFVEGEDFPARDFENALDKLTMEVQEVKENLERSIILPPTSTEKPIAVRDNILQTAKQAQETADTAIKLTDEAIVFIEENTQNAIAVVNTTSQNAITEVNQVAQSSINELETTSQNVITEVNDKSEAFINKSRIWAEGEQEEVQELGGTLSSMGAADLAYAIANAPRGVPIDASGMIAMNIVKGEKGDKGDKGDKGEKGDKGDKGDKGERGREGLDERITNCITEIPQDIKLELVDGVLTLKAGSKVYIPNGFEADGVTPKFDVFTVQFDLSYIEPSTKTLTTQVFYNTSNNTLMRRGNNPESGSSVPSEFNSVFYNTSTNLCYNYASGTQESKVSFPICICTSNGQETNNISSIDQVFNGFGYIGSTVFALPGVKGLIPNGRNEDGSLNNIEFTVDNVWLGQTAYNTNKATLGVVSDMKALVYVTDKNVVYDESCNKNKLVSNGNYWQGCFAGDVSVSDMKFTSLTPKPSFRVVDYSDVSSLFNSFIGKLYPVGSYYLSADSVCPLQSLINGSTWEVAGTSIVKSVGTTAGVRGNGITLGLTNGSSYYGIAGDEVSNQYRFIGCGTGNYGKSVGTAANQGGTTKTTFGVTTDASKSGMVADVSSSSIKVNIFRRVS